MCFYMRAGLDRGVAIGHIERVLRCQPLLPWSFLPFVIAAAPFSESWVLLGSDGDPASLKGPVNANFPIPARITYI
jgi:hypothetical protein